MKFRLADEAVLDDIDERFISLLANDEHSQSQQQSFRKTISFDEPANEYGLALVQYYRGILLKERIISVSDASLDSSYKSVVVPAERTLAPFQRLVSITVVDSIRFSLNNLVACRSIANTTLDPAIRYFKNLIAVRHDPSPDATVGIKSDAIFHPLGPDDRVTHNIVLSCQQIMQDGTLDTANLAGVTEIALDQSDTTSFDRSKANAICADHYLKIRQFSDAYIHLQRLAYDPTFKNWANQAIKEMNNYE